MNTKKDLETITRREFYSTLYEQKKDWLTREISKEDSEIIFAEYNSMETDILFYQSIGYNIRYFISKDKELSYEYYYNSIGFKNKK